MRPIAFVALLGLFPACTATPAEVATYDAIAPEFAAYVQADPKLDAMAIQRRLDLLHAWAVRIGRVVPK